MIKTALRTVYFANPSAFVENAPLCAAKAPYAEFEENSKGSIEPGKLADLTVISDDITKISAKQILSIHVLKTFVGGKLVFDDSTQH